MKSRLICALTILAVTVAHGQNVNTDPGYIPSHPYGVGDVDSVDYASGGLSIHIPIRSFKQQDPVSIDYSIEYGSKHLSVGISADLYTNSSAITPMWVWTDSNVFDTGFYLFPSEQPTYTGARFTTNQDYRLTQVEDANGSDNNEGVVVSPDGGRHPSGYDSNNQCRTIDTSGYVGGCYVRDPSKYGNSTYSTIGDRKGVSHAAWYENQVHSPTPGTPVSLLSNRGFTDPTIRFDPSDNTPTAIWDTKGLVLPWADINTGHVGIPAATSYCPSATNSVYAVRLDMPAPSGSTSTYFLCYSAIHVQTNFPQQSPPPGYDASTFLITQAASDFRMLTAVVLPNGKAWQFQYDDRDPSDTAAVNYGTLTRLTYPTGAYTEYTYNTVQPCGPVVSGAGISRFLIQRDLYDGIGAVPTTWSYSYTPGTSTNGETQVFTPAVMTVTRPDKSKEVHTLDNGPQSCAGYEVQLDIIDAQGVTVMSQAKNYAAIGGLLNSPNYGYSTGPVTYTPSPTVMVTTLADGTQSTQYQTFDFRSIHSSKESYGNVILSCTAPGPMPPTGIVDCTNVGQPYKQNIYAYYTTFFLPPDLVQEEIMHDGTGQVVADTKYQYTGYENGHPYETLFEKDEWLNSGGAGRWVKTLYGHDSHGTTTSITDANNNTTNYVYDSNSVYLQTSTPPSTNGVQHVTTNIYDPNTDLISQSYGENGSASPAQSSAYQYDGLLRLKSVSLPVTSQGQGGATISYDDDARTVTATLLQRASPLQKVVISKAFDTRGRPSTSSVMDGIGPIRTDTFYDAFGRATSVSNPYRSITDSTYGLTCTTYDVLGRTLGAKRVTGNDCNAGTMLSSSSTHYTGRTVDTYDGNNNHSRQVMDVNGRLATVFEPDAANNPTLETDYGYDALGNLTSVHQVGNTAVDVPRNRRFDYDSLSRMVASLAPETGQSTAPCVGSHGVWSICYTYDDVGNPTSKTDARQMTTLFQYDALNRLTMRRYLNAAGTSDDANTPTECFAFEEQNGSQNSKGLLTSEWTQRGSTCLPNATRLTSVQFDSYDLLGRSLLQRRCVFTNCRGVAANYDLAGNLIANGPIANTYDTANRLQSVIFFDSGQHPVGTPVYNVRSFGPAGPTALDIGTSLTKVLTYDGAFRKTSETTLVKPQ